jgi:2-hydroxychromene-2-carboxylate isomerase
MTAAAPTPAIEVFADIWCPFTHFGLKMVSAHLKSKGRPDVPIWVRSWPLEWVNGRAMDPNAALEHARELREQVSPQLFERFDPARFPHSTIPLLATVARGYRIALEVGQALSFEIRDSLFERGQDVADPDVLAALAIPFGVGAPDPDDYATVVADWKEGGGRGVLGSPHFFCGTSNVFCPSLQISKNVGETGKIIQRNLGRLSGFLDGCL